MTTRANARVAGVAFLAYIATGVAQMLIGSGSIGTTTGARLASLGHHAGQVRANAVLGLAMCFMALLLAATLYGLTREESNELALFACACRIAEGILGAFPALASMGLLWLATARDISDPSSEAIAGLFWKVKSLLLPLSAVFFAIGSTVFAGLMLRGRTIPRALAWVGVVASLLLIVVLPLQFVGLAGSPITDLVWLPMALFEVPLGVWLIARGSATKPTPE